MSRRRPNEVESFVRSEWRRVQQPIDMLASTDAGGISTSVVYRSGFLAVIFSMLAAPVSWAHFPFSYSAVESVGLVQSAFPSFGTNEASIVDFSGPRYDYLRLQPLVPGYTWHYQGTINNTKVTLPAELIVEVVSALKTGSGRYTTIDYTVRHTVTFGAHSAVTTITGVVAAAGDRVLSTSTVSSDNPSQTPSLERVFADGGLANLPRWLVKYGGSSGAARLTEHSSDTVAADLGGTMRVEVGWPGKTTIALGSFDTLPISQSLEVGSLEGHAPVFNSDGAIYYFPAFRSFPPKVRVTANYAYEVGPVRITWTQEEAQRETISGELQLVSTNFPVTPQPLLQPEIMADLASQVVELGGVLRLSADVETGVIRYVIPSTNLAPFTTPISSWDGIAYRWTTPRGERWTNDGNFFLANTTASDAGEYQLEVTTPQGTLRTSSVHVTVVAVQPRHQTAAAGQSVALNVIPVSAGTPALQWTRNGAAVAGATGTSLVLDNLQPGDAGIYAVTASGSAAANSSVIVGLSSDAKLVGQGMEFPDLVHPATGNVYDQILLQGSAATITADAALGQITRISFIDLNDDIVQVELSGPGSLTLVLEGATGPDEAVKYYQPLIAYMKGHAGIVVTGATEFTNLSVFSVGKIVNGNPALYREGATYDGVADIAFVAISSENGKFGGLRTANASYFGSRGCTGVYAPGVAFQGPVFIGDITASDQAKPMILLGSASDVRITGGDMLQANGEPVHVSGIEYLKIKDGTDSHGRLLPARTNRAVFAQDGDTHMSLDYR